MATQTSKDEAAKARIIKHMNADHAESLSYFLQHYCSLPSRTARGAVLSDISLYAMILRTTDNKTHTVPISPPMTSFAEARTRSVDMDRESRAGLNISSIRITSYEPPRGLFQNLVFAACIFAYWVFVLKSKIVPGTWFYDVPLQYWPGGPDMFVWIASTIALPVLLLHLAETYVMTRRLRKYNVETGTALWWKWVVSCFIEGFGAHQRVGAAVESKEKEAEAAKH